MTKQLAILARPLQRPAKPTRHNSEDCSVLYRSRSSGRSHGETEVIVRSEHSDWTGPSCGPPFWAGFRPDASLARPPGCKTNVIHRPHLVWSRRWNTQSAGLLHGARCDFASEAIVGEGTVGCQAVASETKGKQAEDTVGCHGFCLRNEMEGIK